VTARVGVKFGFEYRIVGEPADAPVTIERVTIFPPRGCGIPTLAKTIYREEVVGQNRIGEVADRGYEFDHPWELVPDFGDLNSGMRIANLWTRALR